MRQPLQLEHWGLRGNEQGQLMVGGLSTVDLAAEYGTPLHVVNEERLQQTAQDFLSTIASEYPGRVSVHYPFKCNSVPAVVNALRTADLKAEVMTEFELELALRIGYTGPEIIVNGPCKTKSFLQHCIAANVRLIIVDSIPELLLLKSVAGASNSPIDVLLRVNPDYVPHGMNEGSATGSRRGCAFGLDLKGEEVQHALRILSRNSVIRFQGLHMHIGTGIRDPRDYGRALGCLPELVRHAAANGFRIRVLDTGGGFASMTTREFTSREMLLYGGFGKLPLAPDGQHQATFREFAGVLSHEITRAFSKNNLPELILEPGRCIASPNQFLLLSVHYTKERRGAGKWLITDGGLGTVTMPTYYEYHETFLCNDVNRRPEQKVTIVGPACFAGDVVYRNKWMPIVHPGEVLAIMDTGAYFTALESSFGFPRPAIVVVRDGRCQIARRRETFEDLIARDHIEVHQEEEVS